MKSTDSHCFQLGGSVYSYVCEGKKNTHFTLLHTVRFQFKCGMTFLLTVTVQTLDVHKGNSLCILDLTAFEEAQTDNVNAR